MEPIMTFHMTLDRDSISRLDTKTGGAVIIPFTGYVKSPLFSGTVLPGAADVQVINPAGVRHMCASYMFEGTDSLGNACRLFVKNNGYFERGSTQHPFEATPTFLTDSPVLAPYLHSARFRAEGHGTDAGVDILIFDLLSADGVPAVKAESKEDADRALMAKAAALCAEKDEIDADLLQDELGIARSEAKQLLQQLWQEGVIEADGTVRKD